MSPEESAAPEGTGRRTFLLVDGENIDATLGTSILQRRPASEERPRWERLTDFAAARWRQPATGLFFLNASSGTVPASFVQALLAMDYRPIPLAGADHEKVVDEGILRTLAALRDRPDADVILVSHDADFARAVAALVGPERRVGIMSFPEFTATELKATGAQLFDLEDDVAAFNIALPRVRIIPLAEFDPERYLR